MAWLKQRAAKQPRDLPRQPFTPFGWLFYRTGVQTEYAVVAAARLLFLGMRWLAYGARWTIRLFFKELKRFLTAVWDDLCAPWRQMHAGLANLRAIIREERAFGGLPPRMGAAYIWRGIRANRGLVWRGASYLLPAAALVLLIITVQTMLSVTFALRVEYRDEFLGFVAHESVCDAAFADIMDRVQGADTKEDWNAHPEYTLTIVDRAALYSSSELANRIIETSASEFCSATGVYVNGEFIGVTEDSAQLSYELDALRAPLRAGHEDDPYWRVEFQQQVTLKPGLYFTKTLIPVAALLARLHGEAPVVLADGTVWEDDDLLAVQAVQQVSRTVEVELPEQVINDTTLEWGETVVEQEASAGLEELYEEVVYINGSEVRRTEIRERTVLLEAKPRITRRGVNNPYGGAVGDAATGTFIWPVPDYRKISRWVGGPDRHRGADIVADRGTVIVAADNGIVDIATDARGTAQWSYGLFVRIDHGNGYATLYAHCSELLVSQGEYVKQGQPIARVGSTGRSTGAHCHFEIQLNGQWMDTRQYVMPPDE